MIDLKEHQIGNERCETCLDEIGCPSPEECYQTEDCKGFIHHEFADEHCTEDYSDCWLVYNFKCDICEKGYSYWP